MASIKMISEEEATDKVKEIYDDIKLMDGLRVEPDEKPWYG